LPHFLTCANRERETSGNQLDPPSERSYLGILWSVVDRRQVIHATAERIRERLKHSNSLIYAFSENARHSQRMPWELVGFFDGPKGRVALLPVVQVDVNSYHGSEYLGLYPYITDQLDRLNHPRSWVNSGPDLYVEISAWLNGSPPVEH